MGPTGWTSESEYRALVAEHYGHSPAELRELATDMLRRDARQNHMTWRAYAREYGLIESTTRIAHHEVQLADSAEAIGTAPHCEACKVRRQARHRHDPDAWLPPDEDRMVRAAAYAPNGEPPRPTRHQLHGRDLAADLAVIEHARTFPTLRAWAGCMPG